MMSNVWKCNSYLPNVYSPKITHDFLLIFPQQLRLLNRNYLWQAILMHAPALCVFFCKYAVFCHLCWQFIQKTVAILSRRPVQIYQNWTTELPLKVFFYMCINYTQPQFLCRWFIYTEQLLALILSTSLPWMFLIVNNVSLRASFCTGHRAPASEMWMHWHPAFILLATRHQRVFISIIYFSTLIHQLHFFSILPQTVLKIYSQMWKCC